MSPSWRRPLLGDLDKCRRGLDMAATKTGGVAPETETERELRALMNPHLAAFAQDE